MRPDLWLGQVHSFALEHGLCRLRAQEGDQSTGRCRIFCLRADAGGVGDLLLQLCRQLGKLVKGTLIGIRVVQRGASPRIVSAVVIGTRGTTTVTGSQLQSAFGLLSTWANFITISAAAGQVPVLGGPHALTDVAIITELK